MSAIENIGAVARSKDAPREAATETGGEFLTFRLATEEYAIDILKVQEIRGYEQPTRIAGAPEYIKGVVNLRGVIVPIADLRLKFHLAQAGYDGSTVVIILNVGGRVLGMVVDSVSDVIELQKEQVQPAPEFSAAVDAGYIKGIGSVREGDTERMLILVDIERLFSSADFGLLAPSTQAR